MSKLFFVISALLLATAAARAPRDAPQQGNEIDGLFKNLMELFDEGKKNVFDFMGVKNDEEATNLIKTEGQVIFDKLSAIGADFKKTSDDVATRIENDENVKAYRAKLSEAMEEFKKTNPEIAESALKMNEKLQSVLANVAAEVNKLAGSAQSPEFQQQFKDIAKKVFETTSETVKDLNAKLANVGKQ